LIDEPSVFAQISAGWEVTGDANDKKSFNGTTLLVNTARLNDENDLQFFCVLQ